MVRLILFLVRLKLGVKKSENFRFTNQKDRATYFITSSDVWKVEAPGRIRPSGVSLHWLMSPDCKIETPYRR
jgi:hypothetical protein